jgi:hypothetical protein
MIIEAAHVTGGHMAAQKTLIRVNRTCYFPGMKRIVAEFILRCRPCQAKSNKANPQQMGTLASVQAGFPFQGISIDFVGPLSASSKGNKYILTVKDCFTRWIEAFPIVAATALATVDIPEIIHSDRGNQFTSNLFHSVAQEYGIQVTTTPAYNPKSNPVERVHRDLGTMLRALSYDTHQDWEDLLPQALFAIRTAVSKSIGLAPYQLLFGRDASQPIDIAFGKPPMRSPRRSRLPQVRGTTKEQNRQRTNMHKRKIALAITRQRRNYNQDAKEINIGQKVWLFTPVTRTGKSRKLAKFWSGPWIIHGLATEEGRRTSFPPLRYGC